MKYLSLFAALFASANAFSIPYEAVQSVLSQAADTEKFHVELGLGDTRWITEEEKWVLRRVCFS